MVLLCSSIEFCLVLALSVLVCYTSTTIPDKTPVFNCNCNHGDALDSLLTTCTNLLEESRQGCDTPKSRPNFNHARGKYAWQSTILGGLDADLAVDGNKNPVQAHGSCTHTQIEKNPWWTLYLGDRVCVKKIEVKMIAESCCAPRFKNVQVTIGDDPRNLQHCATFPGSAHPSQLVSFICPQPMCGRFVKIQSMSETYLEMCEVEIFS